MMQKHLCVFIDVFLTADGRPEMKTALTGFACAFLLLAFACVQPLSAHAQEGKSAADLIPPVAMGAPDSEKKSADGALLEEGKEGPDIRLTPDRSEIVRVPREVGSVVIGNPENLGVFVDTPQSLVLVPKSAGTTYFTVLDKTGNIMVERHVIVAAPKRNYVRIRTVCTADNADTCVPTKIYYCPDKSMCHDVPMAMGSGKKSQDKTATELGKLMMKSINDGGDAPAPAATGETSDTSE